MPRSLLLALCGGLALAALLLVLWPDAETVGVAPEAWPVIAPLAAPATAPVATRPSRSGRPPQRVAVDDPPPAPPAPRVLPATRERTRLAGRVVDETHRPAAQATVTVQSSFGSMPEWADLDDDRAITLTTTTDASGAFVFADLPIGPYRLEACTADGRRGARRCALVPGLPAVEVDLAPAPRAVAVQVVDQVSRPIADVLVTFFLAEPRVTAGPDPTPPTARSDAKGIALLPVTGPCTGAAVVLDHHGSCGAAPIPERATALRLVLGPAGQIVGALRGAPPAELTDARITAWRAQGSQSAGTLHLHAVAGRVDGGRYQFAALPPGSYAVVLHAPRGWTLHQGASAHWPLFVQVEAGTVTVQDLDLTRGGAIAGAVLDQEGRAVAGARIAVARRGIGHDAFGWTTQEGTPIQRFDSLPWTGPEDPQLHATVCSDAAGRYRCDGLAPGTYAVTVAMAGLTTAQDARVEVRGDAIARHDARLTLAGALQLVVDGGEHIGLFRPGEARAAVAFVAAADGLGTVPDLRPGPYRVQALGRGQPLLGEVVVRAGRTTWADLRNRGPVAILGRVIAAGQPVADAVVSMPWSTATTDAEGRFAMGWPGPLPAESGWCFQVRKDGGAWQVPFPDDLPGSVSWRGDLQLGEHELVVATRDAEGQPRTATLTVSALLNGAALSYYGTHHSEDGTARVPALPAGSYHVSARFADGATVTGTCRLPSRATLELRAPQAGAVRIRLLDARGQALPGQTVGVLGGVRDLGYGQHTATTDAQGEVLLPGLPIVELTVGVFHWMVSGGEEERDPAPAAVRIHHGATREVVLQMRR